MSSSWFAFSLICLLSNCRFVLVDMRQNNFTWTRSIEAIVPCGYQISYGLILSPFIEFLIGNFQLKLFLTFGNE